VVRRSLPPCFRGLSARPRRSASQVISIAANLGPFLLRAGPGGSGCVPGAEGVTVAGFIALLSQRKRRRKTAGRRRGFARAASRVCGGSRSGLRPGLNGLELDLVYNRRAGALPRPSRPWRRLPAGAGQEYGVVSTGSTPANMPISGWSAALAASGQLDDYLALLRRQPPAGESRSGDVPPADQRDCRAGLRLALQPSSWACPPAAATCAICCSAIPPVIRFPRLAAHCFRLATAGSGSAAALPLAAMISVAWLLLLGRRPAVGLFFALDLSVS